MILKINFRFPETFQLLKQVVEHEIDQKISKIKYQYASQNGTINNFNNLILVLNTTDDILKPMKKEIEYSERSFKTIFEEVKNSIKITQTKP
jgi:hypothetical protein